MTVSPIANPGRPRRPPGRYDERRALPHNALVVLAVLGCLLLVGFAYVAYDRSQSVRVTFGLLGYDVVSDTRTVVRFEVRLPRGKGAACRLEALDRDGFVVGTHDEIIGKEQPARVTLTTPLTTSHRAATGQVVGCVPH